MQTPPNEALREKDASGGGQPGGGGPIGGVGAFLATSFSQHAPPAYRAFVSASVTPTPATAHVVRHKKVIFLATPQDPN